MENDRKLKLLKALSRASRTMIMTLFVLTVLALLSYFYEPMRHLLDNILLICYSAAITICSLTAISARNDRFLASINVAMIAINAYLLYRGITG